MVFAFHSDIENSKRTKNMIKQAKEKGIKFVLIKKRQWYALIARDENNNEITRLTYVHGDTCDPKEEIKEILNKRYPNHLIIFDFKD